ncbi:RNA polymerase sigma-70 factor [Parabacteroides johnsonii]|jgi:RNA polymerase sigma-70 factor|uniref:RNA polymerase sigma-70 factor n=1 Tax=Parabacteroides johnsonii TaxID=387661 RepID=UPI00242D2509|nr:RNA polymerase sigma-70 factor [Parabacteroides johnsonii]
MLYLKGDFEKLYKLYYPKMFAFAKNYVPANEDAENIVQDVFLILWERKEEIEISFTLTTYLFTLVKNRCLNFLRHKLIEEEYNSQMKEELGFKLYALETFNYSYQSEEELQEVIQRALDTLPERCREVFIKSRIEGLKYKEISDELGISVNTVENQMVTALKKLRVALKDYLPLLLFLVN